MRLLFALVMTHPFLGVVFLLPPLLLGFGRQKKVVDGAVGCARGGAVLTPPPVRLGSITVPLWSLKMPTLTIKGLPDPVYQRLKAQADAHRRSLNGEIIVCLERAVRATRLDPAAWLSEARTFREGLKIQPLTDRELRAARQAGHA